MCYKWPGPRCYSHGKEDYNKKEQSFVDATMIAVKTGEAEHMENAEAAKKEMIKAEMEMYATKEGLGVLKAKLDKQFENKEITGNQRHDQFHNAQDVYTTRMNAYDRKNKTVDGRKPSKEWRPEDQRKIVNQINSNSLLLTEYEKDRNKTAKIKPLQNKQRLLQNRIDHARMTKNHITEKGYLTAADVESAHASTGTKSATAKKTASTFAPKKSSVKKPEPFYAEPAAKDENGGWVGAKYDRSRTNQQVASATRGDIKKAVSTGTLPSEYTYKVKNSGSRIEVDVIGNHDNNIERYSSSSGGVITRVSSDGIKFKEKVQSFPNQYAYNKSQAQFDNFNQSHNIFVNFIDGATGKNVRH
jgi:hypothetical protein